MLWGKGGAGCGKGGRRVCEFWGRVLLVVGVGLRAG